MRISQCTAGTKPNSNAEFETPQYKTCFIQNAPYISSSLRRNVDFFQNFLAPVQAPSCPDVSHDHEALLEKYKSITLANTRQLTYALKNP